MSSTNTSCLFSDSCFTWSVIEANFWLALSWSSTSLCRLMGIRNVQRWFWSAKPLAEENGISSVEKLPGTLAGRMTITSALMPSPLHAGRHASSHALKKTPMPKRLYKNSGMNHKYRSGRPIFQRRFLERPLHQVRKLVAYFSRCR